MFKVMHANEAAAWGALLSRVQVFSVYPITPQTTIPEKLAEFEAKGLLNAKSIHTESEASAAASVMGACRMGARAFTATSSQGLWLMAEQIYSAGVRRLPLVMVNVNRTLGPPWSIMVSHEDSLALRDIPWLQFYAASAQEVLDSVILGYKIAEKVYLPVMINLDGFYLSHASEVVEVPDQELVDEFLPPYKPMYPVDFQKPMVFDPSIDDDYLTEFRHTLMGALKDSSTYAQVVQRQFWKIFGRKYGAIETYKMRDAKMAIVVLGSAAGTIKTIVDRVEGVGLVRIRMFRPFPKEELRNALAGIEKIAVIDRDMQGIVAREISESDSSRIVSFIAGLGGRDINPDAVAEIIAETGKIKFPQRGPFWIDLKTAYMGGAFFSTGDYPPPKPLVSKNTLLKNITGEELISPGDASCQGCGMTIASRYILKALGSRTIETRPASCSSVVNGRFPHCASLYPIQNVCFEEAAAEASGFRVALDALGIKDVNVLAFAGDGGTYDIGLQAISGAAERNDDIIFVCYDNEAYMNTGIQRSSSTPTGAVTTTTPKGKTQRKKDIMAIMAAHRIPYCATASIAYPEDLLKKTRKAKKIKGFKFILIFSSCPTGWKFSTEKTIAIARLAVETRVFPLYEIFDGVNYRMTKMPRKRPVEDYLKTQGRFGSLDQEQTEIIQRNVDEDMARLRKLSKP